MFLELLRCIKYNTNDPGPFISKQYKAFALFPVCDVIPKTICLLAFSQWIVN